MKAKKAQPLSGFFHQQAVRVLCLFAGTWILASCAATTQAQDTWVRTGPFFYSNGREAKPRIATATDSSLTSTDGQGNTNTISWSIPPATLVVGQEVALTMEATTNNGAPMSGGWRVRDVGEREATIVDTDVATFAGFKKGTFNQGKLVFKFKPGFTPTITLKAGRWDDYSGDMSMLLSWKYEKGVAEKTASANLIQLWESTNKYRWCEEARSFVSVKGAPADVPRDAGMVLVEGQNGKVLETYPVGSGEFDFVGGTKLWIPDDGGWEVIIYVPGTAIMHLEPSTLFTFPCNAVSESEKRSAEIEVSGGVLHWIWDTITGQVQHPDFIMIRTKDAIGGSKERPGNTGRNIPRDTSQVLRAAHHSNPQRRAPSTAERAFTVDQRDSRGTKFLVYKGELEITPTNTALKPFILRAGQQVQVSRSNISAVTPVTSGGTHAAGVSKDSHELEAIEPGDHDLVPLKLYWSAERGDNYSTATARGEELAKAAGYQFARIEGYVFRTQKPGTVPLKNYWSAQRGDNFTTASARGEAAALAAGYIFSRIEGYIYPTQQPGTVPLKNYWSAERGDNFSTATAIGEHQAQYAAYNFSSIEGYIFPSN